MSGSATPSYDDLFDQAGQAYNVDPTLLKAVAQVESSGNPNAVSPAGAVGLMQLMPGTASDLGVKDRTDPAQSISGAAAYLRKLLDKSGGDVPTAVARYNAGPNGDLSNSQTQAYVPKVAAAYQQFAQADTGTATDAGYASAPAAAAPDAAFATRWGLDKATAPASAPAAAPAPQPSAPDAGAFAARWGLEPAAAPAAATPTAAQAATPSAPPLDTTGQPDTIYPGARAALAPAPNTTYGQILPFAKDNTTGKIRLALPSSMRDLAEGGLDLVEGPATGTVTPAATMALASGAVPGVMGRGMMADAADVAAPAAIRQMPPSVNALATPDGTVTNALAARPVPMAVASDSAAVAPAAPNALATPPGAPIPASMGAASSRDASNPLAADFSDPREAAASRATGEAWQLAQGAPAGRNTTIYVPGYKPTAADVAGDPGVSGQQKAVSQVPGNEAAFVQRNQENNNALIDYFDEQAGTPTTLNTLKQARKAQADQDLTAAWANKGQADPQPVVDTINSILTGPEGVRPAIKKAMGDALGTLQASDGSLQTDPQMLYGARKAIDDAMSKAGQQDDPLNSRIVNNLQEVKDSLDSVITPAAPGFDTYLQNYAAASKPIDTQQLLQGFKPDLTNAAGTMTLEKVNSMMKQIVGARQATGIDPAHSIDDDTMDNLFNLRSQLLQQNNRNLGKPNGSDTSQLLAYGSKLGLTAAHGIAAHAMPVVGNALVHFGANALSARSLAKRTNALLNPDLSGPNLDAP